MTYRDAMPRLALVMLALTAAYGVYEFQLVFVPWWIALASASGFIAAATPLPWGLTLDDLRPEVGRLIGGRPEKWQRRNP